MEWIPTAERLPEEDGAVLVHCPTMDKNKPLIMVAWYEPGFGWSLLPEVFCDGVSHWMPLPSPPR